MLARFVDMPAVDLVDRIELARVPGTPKGNRRALIKNPPECEPQHRLAKALPRQRRQLTDGAKILREAGRLEFRIDFAQIVALETSFSPSFFR